MDQLLMPSLALLLTLPGLALAQDSSEPAPPSEEEETLESDDWTPDSAKAPEPEAPWRSLSAGGSVGLALPRSALQAGPSLELEARWRPESLKGRVQPTLGLSRSSVSTQGTLEDDAFPAPYTWTLSQSQLMLQPGVTLRVLPPSERAQPELGLAPTLVRTRSTLQGNMEGAADPVRERLWSVGWVLSPGLAVGLPSGELNLHFEVQRVSQAGTLTGQVTGLQLSPSIGYQHLF